MMKYYYKLILFVSVLTTVLTASGMSSFDAHATQTIDGYTFLQLSKSEKIKLIKKSQELAARIEQEQISARKTKTSSNKYSNLDYKKYLKFLSHSIDNNAYALDVERQVKRAQKRLNKHPIHVVEPVRYCIYAGWLSLMTRQWSPKTGKEVEPRCTHPSKVPIESISNAGELAKSLIARAHSLKDEFKTSCKATNEVTCSPTLFGKQENGKPFCAVGNVDSYNSSFHCLEVSSKYNEENENYDVLARIVDDVSSNQENLSNLMSMFNLYYDVCMCQGNSGFIDKSYAKRMYNRRTCYAWMQQTQYIMESTVKRPGVCKLLQEQDMITADAHLSMASWLNKAEKKILSTFDKYSSSIEIMRENFKKESLEDRNKEDKAWEVSRAQDYQNNKKDMLCPIKIIPEPTPVVVEPVATLPVLECSITQQKVAASKPRKGQKDAKPPKQPKAQSEDNDSKAGENTQKQIKPIDLLLSLSAKGDDGNDLDLSSYEYTVTWKNAKVNKENQLASKFTLSQDDEASLDVIASIEITKGESDQKRLSCTHTIDLGEDEEPVQEKKENKFKIKAKIAKDNDTSVELKALVTRTDGKEVDLEKDGLTIKWTIAPEAKKEDSKKKENDSAGEEDLVGGKRDIAADKDKDKEKYGKYKKLDEGEEVETDKLEVKQRAIATLYKGDKELGKSPVDISPLEDDSDQKQTLQNGKYKGNQGPKAPQLINIRSRLFNNQD